MFGMVTGFINDFMFTILTCLPKLQQFFIILKWDIYIYNTVLMPTFGTMFTNVTKVYWLL